MCAVVLLDVFMPRGSVVGFLANMALLGFVTGVVIGYTWICDKCESYFSGRLDRLLSRASRTQRCGKSGGPGEPAADGAKGRWPRPVYP